MQPNNSNESSHSKDLHTSMVISLGKIPESEFADSMEKLES